MVYLVEKGRLPRVALERLMGELEREDSGLVVAALDLPVARALQRIPREDVPDMPDRIIAATALRWGVSGHTGWQDQIRGHRGGLVRGAQRREVNSPGVLFANVTMVLLGRCSWTGGDQARCRLERAGQP